MLSGEQDEVVPREHMQALWELVKRRDAGVPLGTSPRKLSSASSTSGSGLTSKEAANTGTIVHIEDRNTLSKFVEFAQGTHSKSGCRGILWGMPHL